MLIGGFTNHADRGIYKPCWGGGGGDLQPMLGDLQTMLIGGFTNHAGGFTTHGGDLQTMLIGGFTNHADQGIYKPC